MFKFTVENQRKLRVHNYSNTAIGRVGKLCKCCSFFFDIHRWII